MRALNRFFVPFVLVMIVGAGPAWADAGQGPARSAPRSSSKGRVIGVAVGAAAGFAAGIFLGLNRFDDAINSDRKVWTTGVVMAAGGGLAGYFIGNAIDRRGEAQAGQPSALPLAGLPASPAAWLGHRPCSVRLGCGGGVGGLGQAAP